MDIEKTIKKRAIESYRREKRRLSEGKRPMSQTTLDDIKYYRNIWAELGYEYTIDEISALVDIETRLIEIGKNIATYGLQD